MTLEAKKHRVHTIGDIIISYNNLMAENNFMVSSDHKGDKFLIVKKEMVLGTLNDVNAVYTFSMLNLTNNKFSTLTLSNRALCSYFVNLDCITVISTVKDTTVE